MNTFSSKLWYNKTYVLKNGEVSLYLQVVIDGKHKEFPLKLKWPVDKIDRVNGLLLPRKKADPDVNDFNLMIRMEQSKHTEILRTYRIKNISIEIRQFSKENRVFNQLGSFVSYMFRETDNRYKRKEIVKRSWQNHNSTNAIMVEFDGYWNFQHINLQWMKRFKHFLNTKGYKPGHVWTTLKTVKAYLQLAMLEPMLYVDPAAANFSNPEPRWITNYLNTTELRSLLRVYKGNEITGAQRLVLRAFLFTCYTSLRISDVYRANAKWKVNEDVLHFLPKKNERRGKWLSVPLTPLAKQFVINTLGTFFELPSEGQYNLELKDIAHTAGINKNLTSHYGRHTFGYLYMTTVGNLAGLQEILGHSKVETTKRYAHIDDDYKLASVLRIQEEFPDMLLN
ncbi:site-specific integrase [Mucilaginibacter sp. SP1R1]|uniref:site-specific integrase n=1 Tax=Mucilaginibacter sp. SP1R1 TaxID=2723091 RepID=UPI00160D55C0|nr:site-specific recombinase XerC [Mucilaginibacter sp. SP1R1]